MQRAILSLLTLTGVLGGLASPLLAAHLVEVRAVDQQVLMVYLKDGEVRYRDDGTGPSAYDGHAWASGDDELIVFGEPLDVATASTVGSWALTSDEDASYGPAGRAPVAVHRKAKVNGTTHDWEYALDHQVFLRLPEPLKPGARYTLRVASSTGSDRDAVVLSFDPEQSRSEAVHVNLIGYTPTSPVKAADLYLWLGDGGARDYAAFEGNRVWLLDAETGERFEVGEVRFWKKSAPEARGWNLTGSDVWNVDFSGFDRPGRYRLTVEGVGSSAEFEIRDDIWREPYKTSVRGYYYMRVGEDPKAATPVPRQPRFLPGKDPEGFTVYLTDLDPFDPEWEEHPGDTWDEPHFKPAVESMFWKHRLPGHPTNPDAFGGHSDALDWDRHLAHVSNIYDLLLPYLVTGGALAEDNLDIAESGNGIPDLVDEARNEVDLFLRLRDGEAYAQGLTNPSEERTAMFQAGTTTMAAWANAANAAMLADAFRVSGHSELMAQYRNEAITAFRFAERQENQQLDDHQGIGDAWMRGRDFRMMAAAFLYNVTGDAAWEDAMAAESVVKDGPEEVEQDGRDGWVQTWGAAAYLFSPRERHHPELAARMREAIRRQSLENNVRHMDLRPSRRSSNRGPWRTPHNLQLVVLAHALSDDPAERTRLQKAMVLEADWGLGRNPSNIVEMTGLGSRNIVSCYTSGRNDGTPGLHPGHTPYNNLGSWGGTHNGSHPHWFTDRGYPAWEDGWPEQEAHFNSRYTWANAEFTPRQTMRGKMVLYAYLHALTMSPSSEGPAARAAPANPFQMSPEERERLERLAREDHADMLRQLGITRLRPGYNGWAKAGEPNAANYDPAQANPYPDWPDALTLKDGREITTEDVWWQERRPEIALDFEREVYGRVPEGVPDVTWEVTETVETTVGGQPVVARRVVGHVDNSAHPPITVDIEMAVVVPVNRQEPVPALIMLGWGRMPDEPVWRFPGMPEPAAPPSTEQLIAAGWGYVSLSPGSIQPDNGAGLTAGIIGLTNGGKRRTPEQWGALRAWAWGAARALDYLETLPAVDAGRVGIEGVSRYGKAALVTMAFEPRFAVALVGSSGEGGAKPHRRHFGEAVENLTGSGAYHWMAGNFLKYGAAEASFGTMNASDIPVDAHELIALCAPRPTFISYGVPEKGDANWLDQQGSYMATVAAGPVFRLLGAQDLGVADDYRVAQKPPVNTGLVDGQLAWRQHDGGHEDRSNMSFFIAWANRLLDYTAPPAPADQPRVRLDRNSHLAHQDLLAKAKAGGVDLYFEGDSITRRWGATDYPELLAHWNETFHGWNAGNFAWGGDRTENILWRLDNGELDGVHPKVIVLLAGTNNLGREPGDAAQVADITRGVKAIIDACQERAPGATIILTAIFPRNDRPGLVPTIHQINAHLARLADGSSVRFLDIGARLADANGTLFEGMTVDGLHLSRKGYEVWAEALRPILTELLGPPAASDHAPPPTGDPSASER